MQGVHLRKYGVQTTIDFELYEVDGVDLRTDWVPAAADCEVMKDGGASTQCTNTATDEGSTYSIVLTATEMQAARIVLKVVDAATKVFLDKVIIIETYGNASAQHAFDLDDAVRGGMTALPNAAADGAGGLPISDAGGLDMDSILTYAVSSAAWGSINSGTIFRGTVTADDPGVSFTIAGLAGQGVGAFIDANTPWYAYVFRDAGGVAAAPQGEVQKVTGYTSATGLFTTDAFTVAVATGDDVMIVSAALINSLSIKTRVELALPNVAPDAAGGLPTTTKITDARLGVLTDWINGGRLDLLLDAIKAVTDNLPNSGSLNDLATLASRLTAARAGYLDELAAANIPSDIDDLTTNLAIVDTVVDAIKAVTDWQRACSGTVVVNNPGTDTIFDLTATVGTLSTNNDSCNNMQITFYDVSGGVYETRKVNDFASANGRVTLDRNLAFPVDDGVDTFILWNKYSPTAAAGGGASAQEVHEYDVSGITTKGLAGYEIQKSGTSSIYNE
jgi:hypothetical protein